MENAKYCAQLFKDRPMSSMQTAVYWIEYVIRHKGAPHLRSAAAHLNWIQYHLLDVIVVIVLIATAAIWIVFASVKKSIHLLCGKKPEKKLKNK